jgi:hypothetical protein
MLAARQYVRPIWQGILLTVAMGLLGVETARAVTEQPSEYSPAELEELVGPIALYPDDLIAIILPASSYPLQIVEAARYLEDLEDNLDLQPDENWDDSVVALLNYPEIIQLLNEDLDWTWNLGEAVVSQQADVLDAIQDFRGRAMLAGNLKSDDRQIVTEVEEIIAIEPVDPEVIYVPYYEPRRVVVYQPGPVYYYYPRPYPLYYYPYPVHYSFGAGFFWGVTTAYTIGWLTDRVHYHYYGYASHPYYGHYYTTHYYSPHAHRVRHHYHANPRTHVVYDRKHYGNTWQPSRRHGHRPGYRHTDREHTTHSNYADTSRHRDRDAGARIRSSDRRPANKYERDREDTRTKRSSRTDKRQLADRDSVFRKRSKRTTSRSLVAKTDESDRPTTSRRSRQASRTNSAGDRTIAAQSERRTSGRSVRRTEGRKISRAESRTSGRTGRRTLARQQTADQSRAANSLPVSANVTRVSKPAQSRSRGSTRPSARPANRSQRATRTVANTKVRSNSSNRRTGSATARGNARTPAQSTQRLASAGRSVRSSGARGITRGGRAGSRRGHLR